MATIKITALVEDATPTTDDLIYTVDAPGGVPASKKVTIANLLALVDEIRDADGDTKVQVEEAGDEDKIRFDTGGTERLVLDSASLRPTVDVIPAVGKGITDADGDTKVQVEEGADEDKVRIDCGADGEKALFSTVGTESYVQINAHKDEDGDTLIQVEESADEDKIRFDTGGTERAVLDSSGFQLAMSAASPPQADTLVKDNIVKGWIQFNGTGVIAINDSYNVSGIVDVGVGIYTITWDTDFANDDYAFVGINNNYHTAASTFLVGSVNINTHDNAHNPVDVTDISGIAIGDQS